MPTGAIYVGRPSQWGNPFTIALGNDILDTENADCKMR